MTQPTSDAMGTRDECLLEIAELSRDLEAVAALARSGRSANDVMQAWMAVRSGGALLAVTGALARWRTLESLPAPRPITLDGKTLAAGGSNNE
jgi:hypothetical protein